MKILGTATKTWCSQINVLKIKISWAHSTFKYGPDPQRAKTHFHPPVDRCQTLPLESLQKPLAQSHTLGGQTPESKKNTITHPVELSLQTGQNLPWDLLVPGHRVTIGEDKAEIHGNHLQRATSPRFRHITNLPHTYKHRNPLQNKWVMWRQAIYQERVWSIDSKGDPRTWEKNGWEVTGCFLTKNKKVKSTTRVEDYNNWNENNTRRNICYSPSSMVKMMTECMVHLYSPISLSRQNTSGSWGSRWDLSWIPSFGWVWSLLGF